MADEPTTKRKRGRPRKDEPPVVHPPKDKSKAAKNTSITKLVRQLVKNPNISRRELGKLNGISHAAVNQLFKRHGVDTQYLAQFKESRADLFALQQERVLASISDADIKASSIRDRTILFGTLYDKERLERGQSTSNQHVILGAIMATEEEG